ncbi:hypothetical protein [Serratia plymuthica]|uniref:Bacteriophage protein gp46 n=1 Tax=Serratia plymuthica TaxID=82996 RepID=A0A2X4UCC0_SERPL|nr:hypothetical protein [Serratia plymuthica]QPS21353.1 hypothetical protein I6G64_02700 [Serratia plymuthica]QPS62962.1 hypothetical protein I6G52_23445 [Serratia plymuthica]RKS64707.1 hypothetical protein C8E17_4041 [Serratia plymuthica]CAI2455764.1 Uncharacterised protein [Serratia plymuthica]SQI37416.1 Uncharacterised protein [Serratia plymuthica]
MTTSAERKRAQSQRDKANGIITITLCVDSQEMAMILEGCQQRRIAREPYEVTEYLIGLIRQDNRLLNKQMAELRKSSCGKCGDTLPGKLDGCCMQGDFQCWQTTGYKKLMLSTL